MRITSNGFEFDSPVHHSTTLTKSSSSLTENAKRFDFTIDYSGSNLNGNQTQTITITNSKCDSKDSIIANVMSNHPNVFLNPCNITSGSFSIFIRNFGPTVSNNLDISILIVT